MIILSPSWKRGDICNSHNYFKDLKYVVCESQVEGYEKYVMILEGQIKIAENIILHNSNLDSSK